MLFAWVRSSHILKLLFAWVFKWYPLKAHANTTKSSNHILKTYSKRKDPIEISSNPCACREIYADSRREDGDDTANSTQKQAPPSDSQL